MEYDGRGRARQDKLIKGIQMFDVEIVNRGKGIDTVYCGRGSALGNPYTMRDETMRDEVCNEYIHWFNRQIADQDQAVLKQLREIWIIGSKYGRVKLSCFCAPKRCHCETIKKFIDMHQERIQMDEKEF